ncbi:glycosyltransferase [Massilia sp. LXY-6]|uniref:glycosyltransferase n=1 Tax=Massilia sp. LXY-6 TaxID=3379823 RepID=UPI003EE0BBC2
MATIEILSHSDSAGGASRAAYRLYRALRSFSPETRMTVMDKKTDDWRIRGPATIYEKVERYIRPKIGGRLAALQKSANYCIHSLNILPSNMAAGINDSAVDLVNLHWVCGESLSIEDIGKIRKPLVWTFHDMWALCGSEHITDDGPNARWRTGYFPDNRPTGASGLDLDRYTWNRKRRAWKTPIQIVTPSRWLADCVRHSALMKDWPVTVIPNVLQTDVFKPLDREHSRHALNLPLDQQIVLFGALGGTRDLNKGYDLLLQALNIMAAGGARPLCVVFGQGEPRQALPVPFPVRWMGHIGDDTTLALLYSAADVMVAPSRLENLPQSGTEAHACGCPVVAFDCTGLPEVVEHLSTGYLARPFDPGDLANGIAWALGGSELRRRLGDAARARALRLWSPQVVVPAYVQLYESVIESCRAGCLQLRQIERPSL